MPAAQQHSRCSPLAIQPATLQTTERGGDPESRRGTRIHGMTAEMLRKWKATQVPKVLGDWRKPRHEAFEPRTAWSLFNCFTETMKGLSTFNLATPNCRTSMAARWSSPPSGRRASHRKSMSPVKTLSGDRFPGARDAGCGN